MAELEPHLRILVDDIRANRVRPGTLNSRADAQQYIDEALRLTPRQPEDQVEAMVDYLASNPG